MVFDPSVYETASIATETYNPIISDEEWDSDMESDFDNAPPGPQTGADGL